jgi:hypothetical protein
LDAADKTIRALAGRPRTTRKIAFIQLDRFIARQR